MENNQNPAQECVHSWTYFVNLESRAIRVRRCEKCGLKDYLPSKAEPEKAGTARRSA
jgi:hypothetical protein